MQANRRIRSLYREIGLVMARYLCRSTPLAAFLIFGALYAMWLSGDRHLYQTILTIWGISPFRFPFLDLNAVLAARECWAKGIDVFLSDPCDVLGRPHVYSPVWLIGSGFLGTADTQTAGLCLDILFLLSLWLLPQPATPGAFLVTLAATLSATTLYAVERANNDLVIFIVLLASARLSVAGPSGRAAGYAGFFLAAILKFYPAVLVVLALRERPRTGLAVLIGFIGGMVLFFFLYSRSLGIVLTTPPYGSPFTDLFGASNLAKGFSAIVGSSPYGQRLGLVGAPLVTLVALYLCVRIAHRSFLLTNAESEPSDLGSLERQLMVIGMTLLLGCFFAGQSVYYRAIFFLLALPGLLTMARSASELASRRRYQRLVAVILFLMWEEPLRTAISTLGHHLAPGIGNRLIALFWIGRELAWWWLMGRFGGVLAKLLTDNVSGQLLARFVARHWPRTGLKTLRVR